MPVSRHRKVYTARKRPRVPSSNPNASVKPAPPASDRNRKIITIVVIAALAAAVIAYLVTSRRSDTSGLAQTNYETTTDTGLKIHDVKVGDGATPKPGETVVVHYIGWLENGKEFNNSHKMGGPAEFNMNQLIKGWTEGLSTMKVGGKRKLYVPSELAYGKKGNPPTIPPNANLTFELELLDIR